MSDITFIILTFNEQIHIQRCIENIKPIAKDIFIVDSFSTDKTIEIAESLGAKVIQHEWQNNHGKQFNWALDNLNIKTEWVFRLDADEYLTGDLIYEIKNRLPLLPDEVAGVAFPRQCFFMGKLIKKGIVKLILLRLFRYSKGRSEERWMDEHIYITEGVAIVFKNAFADHNLKNIDWWIQKHNGYSIREAIDILNIELQLIPDVKKKGDTHLDEHTAAIRNTKFKYLRFPLFWRAFFLFIYRYFFKFGFINGKEGFLWHFLQAWWYRTLVDAKIFEIKKHCGNDKGKIIRYIKDNYSIDINKI
jgi:glycosyltransferase involved in cell wall biosynthesis